MSFHHDPFQSLQRSRFSPQRSSPPTNQTLPPTAQRRLRNTISTVDFHRQNVAKLDAAIHARVYNAETVRDMASILGAPVVVLNEQLGWFALNCFRFLRYLRHHPSDIFLYIADGFQALNPQEHHSVAREQVMDTHHILAQLAEGSLLSDLIYSEGSTSSITISAENFRMALYCTRLVECIQEYGFARETFYHVMANLKMGIPFKQSFIELGICEPFYSTRRHIANTEHKASVPNGWWAHESGCGPINWSPYLDSNNFSVDSSEYSYKHTSNESSESTPSMSKSEEHYVCQHQDQVQAISAIKVQCEGAMVDAFDDQTRNFYELRFLCEAHQSFCDQARLLQENGLLRL